MKMLCDINVQCENVIEARRQDIILTGKKDPKEIIIDIAVLADIRVGEEEREKMEKHQDLKREISEDCGNSKWEKSFL